jgi:quercetin dioxygenase-like cupin family protein
MTYHIVETEGLEGFSPNGVRPIPLLDTDKVRALLLNIDAGQSVAPCQMSSTVLYYVIEGQGRLSVDGEQAELQTGSLIVVPADAVRSILAAGQMRVLALQIL